MTEDIVWFSQKVTRMQHEKLKNQRSFCLWLTGLSGAGKSTLANKVQQKLYQMGIHTYLLDGDNVRHGLNRDLGFSPKDRKENVRRIAEVAGLFVDAGIVAITALISPFEGDRKLAREIFREGDFIEIFVNCPIEKCIERDPKGLYKKAQAGIIHEFTGITSPYEPPVDPELTIFTAEYTTDECVEQVLEYLVKRLPLGKELTL